MILYFSGTGNSAYVARRIGKETGDEAIDLFEKIRDHDHTTLHSERPWVVVSPTYAWRIPRILQHWLERTTLSGSRTIYFVMTCGGNIGNAEKYLARLWEAKNMRGQGCAPIVMPENYIALFTTPDRNQALEIIARAEGEIDTIIRLIQNGERFPTPSLTIKDRMSSGIVNDLFYPMFVHAKKFTVTDRCVSCGKCANVCPLTNIRLVDQRPVWGEDCTHCMACICRCPVEAIEYGKHSKGLPRYTFPQKRGR